MQYIDVRNFLGEKRTEYIRLNMSIPIDNRADGEVTLSPDRLGLAPYVSVSKVDVTLSILSHVGAGQCVEEAVARSLFKYVKECGLNSMLKGACRDYSTKHAEELYTLTNFRLMQAYLSLNTVGKIPVLCTVGGDSMEDYLYSIWRAKTCNSRTSLQRFATSYGKEVPKAPGAAYRRLFTKFTSVFLIPAIREEFNLRSRSTADLLVALDSALRERKLRSLMDTEWLLATIGGNKL